MLAASVGSILALSALTPAMAAPTPEETPVVPRQGLVAEYLFDQTTGSTIPNTVSGGVGTATVVNGSDSQWTGSSLVFTGGAKTSSTANWVQLPGSILSGKTSATVTIETKLDPSMKSAWHFLWNIGSDSTSQYYFASVKDNPRTAITTAAGGGEANARSGSALSADKWYSITSVIDGAADTISFYIDGVAVATTPTALTPASITAQTLNAIGRAPFPDPMYKGEVSTFRVYDRALSADEVQDVSVADAAIHATSHAEAAQSVLDNVNPVTIDETITTLPNYGGQVSWTSPNAAISVAADGVTATVDQPAAGAEAISTTLTATATVRGQSVTREVPATVRPAKLPTDAFGYAMVHFVENSDGYAEKIYLDVSRGDNPEQWDPLNGGQPILASDLGTTGVRDPYLTFNPETQTYYILATDLRVFGGERGSGSCVDWCYWSSQGSTKLNVWESKDLVTWSDLRQFDLAIDSAGGDVPEMGMSWAPEATWVDDYYSDGRGAFVLYWASNVFPNQEHTGDTYSRILWGASSDFTQETYEYGGVFIDAGGNTIDTTIIQDDGKTYRVTKDNSTGQGLYLESTTATKWWTPEAAWTQIQNRIGAVWANNNPGGVEGPAMFKRHDDDRWYLYVDVIPSTGYRPMETRDLDAGWTQLVSNDFFMAPSTKHGGIVSLTQQSYDTIRQADATGAVKTELDAVEVQAGAAAAEIRAALPATAEVTLAYGRGTAARPIDWETSTVQSDVPGNYRVTGTVRTIGANLNQWRGENGSTAYDAQNRKLYSSTAITVTADVVVAAKAASVSVVAETRCVAGKVVLTVRTTNESNAPMSVALTTAFGSKAIASLKPGQTAASAFTTRQAAIGSGTASVTATSGAEQFTTSGSYPAASCGG